MSHPCATMAHMVRLLHCADLHLSVREAAYGLSVLDEILELARTETVDFLLIAGDLFDTFADAEALYAQVRAKLDGQSFSALFLPGNHECLRQGRGDLAAFDWGGLTLLNTIPFTFLRRETKGMRLEFLALPHRPAYDDYRTWDVPEKTGDVRIALAHGLLAGLVYAGPGDEEGGSALDPDLFARFDVDYVALGHVHRGRIFQTPDRILAYPGSARVWRAGETGEHGVYLLDLDGSAVPRPRFVPLRAAGRYVRIEIPLGLDGRLCGRAPLPADFGPGDAVELCLTGIVEDENRIARALAELSGELKNNVRILTIEREILVLPDIAAHPVARKFLETWEARFAEREAAGVSPDEIEVYLRARELGLREIKAILETHA